MGKKAATKAAPAAVTTPQSVVVANDAEDVSKFLAQTGVKKEEKKEEKSNVPEIIVTDAKIKKTIKKFVRQKAAEKCAAGLVKSTGEMIRPVGKKEIAAYCKENGIFTKTICLDGQVNFGSIQLDVASPNKKNGTTEESIETGLKEIFSADEFKKYFGKTHSLTVNIVNMATVKLLVEKLGADEFKRLFTHKEVLGVNCIGAGEDTLITLQKDALQKDGAKLAVKVEEAIAKHFLHENDGTLSCQPTALAQAGEEVLKKAQEEDKKEQEEEEKAALAKAS